MFSLASNILLSQLHVHLPNITPEQFGSATFDVDGSTQPLTPQSFATASLPMPGFERNSCRRGHASTHAPKPLRVNPGSQAHASHDVLCGGLVIYWPHEAQTPTSPLEVEKYV
jgi:hypothetical protein